MPLGTPRANLEREGEPWYKSGLSLEFTSPVWKTPGPRASIGLPKSSGRHHFLKMPAVSIRRARHWACGAGASMRSLYVPASRECSRTRGSQKPAGIGRTRCPTSSSLVQQATRRDPLSWRWRVERACATCSTQLGTIHVGCLHGGAASSRSHRANLRCDDLRPCASR